MKEIKKRSLKYFFAKIELNRDETFLLKKGMERARETGLDIGLGRDDFLKLQDPKGCVNLPINEDGVDVRSIIATVADDFPEIAKRYIENRYRLGLVRPYSEA